ncbi:dimethylsulfonioproprionate lyase family protein [Phyllobacterium sp. SB3]|uniref:dimethylsulfonioproprionate lyase family protein n=1 Tax=Phyllobacterium sp. SB3 TaxID=3156073 RepID=UPI0032AF20F2
MMERTEALQLFLDATFVAFDRFAKDLRSRDSILRIFALLEVAGARGTRSGKRLPVCTRYLDDALAVETEHTVLRSVVTRFRAIEPSLHWNWRSTYDNSASKNFLMGHANAMIAGPDGVEDRGDLWLGVSLLAPHVRYPDHDHAPEETYLALSEGEFMQEEIWFSPGIGGSFYNPAGIKHAMRSGDKPLFTLWALLPDQAQHRERRDWGEQRYLVLTNVS